MVGLVVVFVEEFGGPVGVAFYARAICAFLCGFCFFGDAKDGVVACLSR